MSSNSAKKIKTLFVFSSFSSGSTALAGFLELCGAYGCPPWTVTNDPRTPSAREPKEYRDALVQCIDEATLKLIRPRADFVKFFRQWHQTQLEKAAEVGASCIVLKHPLQAFFVDELINACDANIIVLTRKFEEIEASRVRRKWHPVYGREGALRIYNYLYQQLHASNKPYLSVPYQGFLSDGEIRKTLLSYCGLSPSADSLEKALEFIKR
jgi:hypothetical protein